MEDITVRNMLIKADEMVKTVKMGAHEEFKIKVLSTKDKKNIARQLAMDYNGLDARAYSAEDRYIFERAVTIDAALEDSPEWWPGADDCLDEDLLDKLFQAILDWNKDFQERLKKNKFTKRSTKA